MTPPLGRVHLIGLGGAGMAGLAQYLLGAGRTVSGSDTTRSAQLTRLAAAGAVVSHGHAAENVAGAAMVVASDAIPAGNIELEASRAAGIPVLRRAECLDTLAEDRRRILVAGSHGKSTTTAMIASVLDSAGLNPAFVLGADVPGLGGTRARAGRGHLFVAEACEAFRNLEHVRPDIAVITNIDDEHVNHYASQSVLDAAFADFAGRAGIVVASGEDPGIARIRDRLATITTFGLRDACHVAANPGQGPLAVRIGNQAAGTIALRLPGDHMRRNALAATAACLAAGLSFDAVATGLAHFGGVNRRWQEVGSARGIRIVDDYAHHPAEIAATLRTARQVASGARLVAAFQPLLHSRVNRLHEEFAESLALADQILLLDVDGGGETGSGFGSDRIALELRHLRVAVDLLGSPDTLVSAAPSHLRPGDFLVVMGGPQMEGVADRLLRRLAPEEVPANARRRAWTTHLVDRVKRPASVVDLVRVMARSGPDRPALVEGAETISYALLDARSDAVAAGLAANRLNGRVIGVCLPQSADLVVGLLGVMKAGCVYLPLDPSLPDERHRFMLERSGAAAVILGDRTAPGAASHLLPTTTLAALRSTSGPVPRRLTRGGDAYICFTSGSTGDPKGIGITHAALLALLQDAVPRFGIGPGARMAFNTSISFDVSIAEICSTLAGGATLVVGAARPLAGERLGAFLADQAITHLSVTPSVLASVPSRSLPALRCIIAAGEALPPKLVRDWGPQRCFWNVYGPTETTIYATASRCYPDAPVTIGTALTHLQSHVLDGNLRPVPVDTVGELCLTGPGVSAGYIGDPVETARRFTQTEWGRVYRTGDMVRAAHDGALFFVGRVDDQVKIRGNRIELEEIERTVLRFSAIVDAAACITSGETPSLVCYVVTMSGRLIDQDALLASLATWLPESAIPARIVQVDSIPLTPSGKKDRRGLLARHRVMTVTPATEFMPPRNDLELRVAALWQDVLALESSVGMIDRFAALGGDSLSASILIAEIEASFGVAVPPGYFGRLSSVPQMAVQLADLLWRPVDFPATAGSRVSYQLRALCSHWAGTRIDDQSLISTLGGSDAVHDLFLCCQEEEEFTALAGHMPTSFRVHAMRSGHLVIDHGPSSVRQICRLYADEIGVINPSGSVIMAGICQGATIASIVAETLSAQGRRIHLLALIEPGRPRPYAEPVALFYAEDSFLNPLRPGGTGADPFHTAFPQGYSTDLIPGSHGGVCKEPAVRFLAHHLSCRVKHAEAL